MDFLAKVALITLVALALLVGGCAGFGLSEGGEQNGVEASVTMSTGKPREHADAWATATGAGEFTESVNAVIRQLSVAFSPSST